MMADPGSLEDVMRINHIRDALKKGEDIDTLLSENELREALSRNYAVIGEMIKQFPAKADRLINFIKDMKPRIEVPKDGNPIGDVAVSIGEYYHYVHKLFFTLAQREIVRLNMVAINNKKEGDDAKILGLVAVDKDAFITMIENDFIIGKILSRDGEEIGFIKKSISGSSASAILKSSDQFIAKLPIIERIYTVPKPLLKNGKLEFPKKGYDEKLRSWMPADAPDVRLDMSLQDGKTLINEIYKEFCFVGQQDRANAIADLITPYCRELYNHETARTPVRFYTANQARAGKDYCAGIPGIVYEGNAIEDPAISSEQKCDNEEFRKKILATCMIGRSRMHSANNKGYLNCAALEAILTSEVITDRILGSNRMATYPNVLEISMSANVGITYTPDLSMRSIFINLFFAGEDPNARKFENPNLHQWVAEKRSEILSAIYALIRDWVEKGMKPGSQPFASFPEWARVVGGIMENAGLGTPMSNDLQNDVGGDTETKNMKALFERCYSKWPESYLPKQQIIDEFENKDSDFADLFDWLDWGDPKGGARMSFGKMLLRFKGRVFSGIRLDVKEETKSTRNRYKWTKQDSGKQEGKQVQMGTLGTSTNPSCSDMKTTGEAKDTAQSSQSGQTSEVQTP